MINEMVPKPTSAQEVQNLSKALTDIKTALNVADRKVIKRTEALERLQSKFGALSFMEKFEKEGFEGFKPGDKVASRFLVVDVHKSDGSIDKTKIGLLVDVNDTRHSDNFIISVTPEEYAIAHEQKGMPFEGVVTITSERRNTGGAAVRISNMDEYDATVSALEANSPVNPRTLEGMERGQPVIVEGRVADFRVLNLVDHDKDIYGRPIEHKRTVGFMRIETSDGRHQIIYIDPSVKFENSGTLENMGGKVPEVGDVVRVNTNVSEFSGDKYGTQRMPLDLAQEWNEPVDTPRYLWAAWCRSTYLIKPSEARQKAYDALSENTMQQLQALTDAVGKSDYKEAREQYGILVKQDQTADALAKTLELINQLPKGERPLIIRDRRFTANDLLKTYGIDVDTLSEDEFYKIVREKVSKPFVGSDVGRGSVDYVFRAMEEAGTSTEIMREIAELAIRPRIDYFKTQDSQNQEYNHDTEWSDKYMLERCLAQFFHHAVSEGDVRSAELLIQYGKEILLSQPGKHELMRDEFAYDVGKWIGHTFDYAAQEGHKEVADVFRRELASLREMEIALIDDQVKQAPIQGNTVIVDIESGQGQSDNLVRHKYSSALGEIRKAIQHLDTTLARFETADFNSELDTYIREVADAVAPSLHAILQAKSDKGYEFIRYFPGDRNIPNEVHALMSGAHGALTYKDTRTVYFDLEAIASYAHRQGESTEIGLARAITDEGMHMLSERIYSRLSNQQSRVDFALTTQNTEPTPGELMVQDILAEEVFADVAAGIVAARLANRELSLDRMLSDPNSPEGKAYLDRKLALAASVFQRVYRVDEGGQLPQEQTRAMGERLARYITSGEIERYVSDQLAIHGI